MVLCLHLLLRGKQPARKEETEICIMTDLPKIPAVFQILWAQDHTWFKISRLSNQICHMERHSHNVCRITWLHNQTPIQPINMEPFSSHLLPMGTVPWVAKLQHPNQGDKATLVNLFSRLAKTPWRIIMSRVHIRSSHSQKHKGKVCSSQGKRTRFRDRIFRAKGRKRGYRMISWEYVGHSMRS